MRSKTIKMLLGIFFLLVFCINHANAEELWIDVRTKEEFQSGHVKGAINIPYDQIGKFIGRVADEKDERIILYCRSGRRSGIAKKTLEKSGYTNVINEGGYSAALKKKALKSESDRLSLRNYQQPAQFSSPCYVR
ncbi:MAG: rhodanese-like domain-containing protein [Deltaproteobacteria bacterium]|nr:rhodanese-like domain-containing protein [Deltaproteobacteria bacterium]MBW2364483.1 rhodanese-like domain-containing protein [Deltaproteobacteria bacterium]